MAREFGIYPNNITPTMWWGARAIATDRNFGIDIPWNRQNFEGDRMHPRNDDFIQWINYTVIPELNKRLKNYDTKRISIDSEDGFFHCEADDRSSGGYLYIGAWTTEKMDK